MLVCYEGILPSFVRNVMVNEQNILINITNDDWFGQTAERYLHLALAIPRSIEHRRSFVRSTLTGVSAFVDPVGRLVEMTKMTDPEIMDWKAPLLENRTLYQAGGHHFSSVCFGWMVYLMLIGAGVAELSCDRRALKAHYRAGGRLCLNSTDSTLCFYSV